MTYAESIEYCYDKYVTSKENLLYTLDKYGVAIIPNVLNSKECEDMISGIWDYYEKIT